MARSQVREVSGPSAIQGIATPTNTYVRPADPSPSSLHQLAEGLAALDSGMGSFMQERTQKAEDADKQRAIHDAYTGASSGFDEGVKRGLIPAAESPTYIKWYKATQGDLRGRELADEFSLAHQQWEGRNSGDPESFKKFVGGFLQERVGDINDPEVLAGLNPHIESIYQNGYGTFTEERSASLKKDALSTVGASVMDEVDRAEKAGRASGDIDYEGLWGAINAQRDEALSLMFRTLDDLSTSEQRRFEENLEPLLEVRCTDPDRFASEYHRQRAARPRHRQHIGHQAGRLAA